MLTKNKIKFLSSLSEKKARMESLSFLVEGEKMVLELFSSKFRIYTLLFTEKFSSIVSDLDIPKLCEVVKISEDEATRISTRKTPQGIFAVAAIPEDFYNHEPDVSSGWNIVLHDIQDPGNLGTIIRTADWFGVKNIICSKDTVDVLNPKVIQSTMGAIFRVNTIYVDLKETILNIKKINPEFPILAAVLEGENIYHSEFVNPGIIMMGNESKGLSQELINLSTHKVAIPRFGSSEQSSESLNVSVATGIILSELKRKTF